MTRVPLNEVKDRLSHYINEASKEEVVVTKHGKPAAVIIGFETEDDWFDYQLENDPRFLRRIEESRRQAREGKYTLIEDLPD